MPPEGRPFQQSDGEKDRGHREAYIKKFVSGVHPDYKQKAHEGQRPVGAYRPSRREEPEGEPDKLKDRGGEPERQNPVAEQERPYGCPVIPPQVIGLEIPYGDLAKRRVYGPVPQVTLIAQTNVNTALEPEGKADQYR